MKSLPHRRMRRYHQGYTLIEVLVVIGIISILTLVALAVTFQSTSQASAKQGAIVASNLFNLVRTEAIRSGLQSALIVDAYADAQNPSRYLHRMLIMNITTSSTNNGTTTLVGTAASAWYPLPNGIYFYPKYSFSTGPSLVTVTNSTSNAQIFPEPNSGASSAPAYCYVFDSSGEISAASQFVVAFGYETLPLPSLPTFRDETRHGVYIHLMGRTSIYPDLGSIQLPP